MSVEQLFTDLLLLYVAALAVLITLQIIGASLYDIKSVKLRRLRRLHPYAKAYRSWPLVTVIVLAQNQADSLKDSLDSLRRSNYRKLQILVVDNASTDDTKFIAKGYLDRYPKLDARLISKRKAADRITVISSLRRYIKGEIVLIADADCSVEKSAIRQAIRHFQEQPDASMVVPDTVPATVKSLRGLMQSYQAILFQRSKKAISILSGPIESNVLIYRRQALGNALRRKPVNALYADDVRIQTDNDAEPYRFERAHHARLFMRYISVIFAASQLLVTILTPLLVSYFIYLAIGLREPLFLLITMGGVALLLLFAVWENDHLAFRERLVYSLGIPITYSSLYITSWWKLIRTIRRPATF